MELSRPQNLFRRTATTDQWRRNPGRIHLRTTDQIGSPRAAHHIHWRTRNRKYLFLIQLVGYHLWQVAESVEGPLSASNVELALAAAHRKNTRVVLSVALATASPKYLEFFRAMPQDDGPTNAAALGKGPGKHQ